MNRTSDWYTVDRIAPESYQITEAEGVLRCNSFLIDGGDEALLIDTGLGIGDLRSVVEELVDGPVRVLLSHSHWDHIGAAHQFQEAVVHERERADDERVTIDTLSDEFVERPIQFVRSWTDAGNGFPDGFDPESYDVPPVENVGTVSPGDVLRVGDRSLELLHIPGHSPGQLAALDRDTGVLYGADVIGIGADLYAHFQDSDVAAYADAVADLADAYHEGAFDVLATGHNEPYRGDEIAVLDDIHAALGEILDDTAEYEVIETDWGPARRYEFDEFAVLTDD